MNGPFYRKEMNDETERGARMFDARVRAVELLKLILLVLLKEEFANRG